MADPKAYRTEREWLVEVEPEQKQPPTAASVVIGDQKMKDRIVDNEIHLYNGEVLSLEEYFDRVTGPMHHEIEQLKMRIGLETKKQASFDGAGTFIEEEDWDVTPYGEQK